MNQIIAFVRNFRRIIAGLTAVFIFSCDSIDLRSDKRFKLLNPSHTGIHFNNALRETNDNNILTYQDFYSGGGVSIGDINNDGLPDVCLTGNMVPAKLFLNIGNLKFLDITESSGLSNMGKGWFTGTSMVDINNDTFLDIYICRSGMYAPDDRENLLFVNNQDNTFTEMGEKYGLNHPGYAVNATFFDYDNDFDLDVFLVNQGPEKFATEDLERLRVEAHEFCGDKLFENTGNKFIDVTEKSGIISSIIGFGHGVAIGDINKDGNEDIYVSNDFFEHDYIYFNNGDKTFRETIKNSTKHISYYSMGNDMADFNNDGWLDIMVLDMVAEDNKRMKENLGGMSDNTFRQRVEMGFHQQYMFNVLHLNNGNETFSEIGMLAGVSNTDWSWGPLFADFDNDGLKDLFVANGMRKDIRNMDWGDIYRQFSKISGGELIFKDSEWEYLLSTMPSEKVMNYMYKNNGDLTFTKVMKDWGIDQPSFSNGAAYGDLDNDGDLDLIVNNIDENVFVYENRSNLNENSHFLKLKFIGPDENPFGLGTQAYIYNGDELQYQQLYLTRGYRSSVDPILHFGLGTLQVLDSILVLWPDGRVTSLENIASDQLIELDYVDSDPPGIKTPIQSRKYFKDITQEVGLNHKHVENEFNDFDREILLPHKLSMLGPEIAVGDVNGDDLEDFFIGGAFRQWGHLFLQTKQGSFKESDNQCWFNDRNFEDTGVELLDIDLDGDLDLYVVSGGNEFKTGLKLLQDRIYVNDGNGNFERKEDAVPELLNSGSVVIPKDFDSDGDADLFIGGRTNPGMYPNPADSYILINEEGIYVDATDAIAPQLKNLGMVTSAVWSDYDSDGDDDLIIVGEWMSITLFQNSDGGFHKVENMQNGLEHSSGWWWSVEAFDFDGDGDKDLIAGNMGKNFKYKTSVDEPFEIYCKDFDGNGSNDIILAYYNEGVLYPVKGRKSVSKQIRELHEQIPTYGQYAVSSVEEIFGKENLINSLHYQVETFESCFVENLGEGKFRMIPLDNYAQISNHNSILLSDVNQDGSEDLILAGNFYPVEVEAIRNDAGIGMWMKGNGNGEFESIPFIKSGLFMDGDVKDIEFITVQDRRVILASKNNDYIQAVEILLD
jgi:hypothetical protein